MIEVALSPGCEEWAKRLRAERDRRFMEHTYEPGETRWVGELGEYVVDGWLGLRGVERTWFRDDPKGNPDFLIRGHPVDVKGVMRKVAPLATYGAQVPVPHIGGGGWFFFVSYEYPRHTMWFLGGIAKERYRELSKRYEVGDQIHAAYTVKKQAIYNLTVNRLTEPEAWLREIAG